MKGIDNMKKWLVGCLIDDEYFLKDEKTCDEDTTVYLLFTFAKDENAAIQQVLTRLAKFITEDGLTPVLDFNENSLSIYDKGEFVEKWHDFTAKIVKISR